MKLTQYIIINVSKLELQQLVRFRRKHKITQADLAAGVEIDVTYISKIENNALESMPITLWRKIWRWLREEAKKRKNK